jgi:AIR synthase-related protein
MTHLAHILQALNESPAVRDKIEIGRAFAPAIPTTNDSISIGDDCAAIPEAGGGHLLLAAEGLLESFVEEDPWFAGYSAVMVNISDICAMGGRPTAIVDVIWAPEYEQTDALWQGMTAAADDYGVPIVGGHTTITGGASPVHLAAAILGRAEQLLTSFDAEPGDELLMVVDLHGSYRGDKPFWNSTQHTPAEKRRINNELLPLIAEKNWCKAGKDISNGGIIGTLIMLLQCSGVGAELHLDSLPQPPDTDLVKWLVSFPSFGFLLSVAPEHRDTMMKLFADHDLDCGRIGSVTDSGSLECVLGSERQVFWQA